MKFEYDGFRKTLALEAGVVGRQRLAVHTGPRRHGVPGQPSAPADPVNPGSWAPSLPSPRAPTLSLFRVRVREALPTPEARESCVGAASVPAPRP